MLDFSWAWGRIAPCDEGRRIRTPVGISQQILSLSRLTAPAFPQFIYGQTFDRAIRISEPHMF